MSSKNKRGSFNVQRDKNTGDHFIKFDYTDKHGKNRQTTRRGFKTKREAVRAGSIILIELEGNDIDDMTLEEFYDKKYYPDMEKRLRKSTMINKKYIFDTKIRPVLGALKLSMIEPSNIRDWQTSLISEGYSPTYLKTINNQLTATINHSIRFFGIPKTNPCRAAGSMGRNTGGEKEIWTAEEFNAFSDSIINKRESWLAFRVLWNTGMRVGELLALSVGDIDLEAGIINISKSLQRIGGVTYITEPKTPRSNRKIKIPKFLVTDIQDYCNSRYGLKDDDKLFEITKSWLEKEMQRGIKNSGVKRIRVHDIRHSHASALIDKGISIVEIAARLGHERIETTLNTYGHRLPDREDQLIAKLEQDYEDKLK